MTTTNDTTTTTGRCSIVDGGEQCNQPSVGTGPNGNLGKETETGPLCARHVRSQQVVHGSAQRLAAAWGWTFRDPSDFKPAS